VAGFGHVSLQRVDLCEEWIATGVGCLLADRKSADRFDVGLNRFLELDLGRDRVALSRKRLPRRGGRVRQRRVEVVQLRLQCRHALAGSRIQLVDVRRRLAIGRRCSLVTRSEEDRLRMRVVERQLQRPERRFVQPVARQEIAHVRDLLNGGDLPVPLHRPLDMADDVSRFDGSGRGTLRLSLDGGDQQHRHHQALV
jgi:hypothetical protein